MKQLYFIYNKFGDLVISVCGPHHVDIYFWWDKFKSICEYPHPEDYEDDEWWNRFFESERIANELGYEGTFEEAFVNYLIKHHEFESADAKPITLEDMR
jgi:hypothetical protein